MHLRALARELARTHTHTHTQGAARSGSDEPRDAGRKQGRNKKKAKRRASQIKRLAEGANKNAELPKLRRAWSLATSLIPDSAIREVTPGPLFFRPALHPARDIPGPRHTRPALLPARVTPGPLPSGRRALIRHGRPPEGAAHFRAPAGPRLDDSPVRRDPRSACVCARACACVCERACVHACVRACVRACEIIRLRQRLQLCVPARTPPREPSNSSRRRVRAKMAAHFGGILAVYVSVCVVRESACANELAWVGACVHACVRAYLCVRARAGACAEPAAGWRPSSAGSPPRSWPRGTRPPAAARSAATH